MEAYRKQAATYDNNTYEETVQDMLDFATAEQHKKDRSYLYPEAQLADEQWYIENYPQPPATHMLAGGVPVRESWRYCLPRFTKQEWRSYVNWNKDEDSKRHLAQEKTPRQD